MNPMWQSKRDTDTRQYDMPHIWVFYEVTHGYTDLPTIRQNNTMGCYVMSWKLPWHYDNPTIRHNSLTAYNEPMRQKKRDTDTRQYDMHHRWILYEVTHGYTDLPTIRQNNIGLLCYKLEVPRHYGNPTVRHNSLTVYGEPYATL